MGFTEQNINSKLLISTYSCFLTSERLNILLPVKNNVNLFSISSLFKSTIWTERELSEFNNVNYVSLKDSRRLLTDYTNSHSINVNTFKTTSYDLINQDLYTRLLQWFFYFLFLFIVITLSFIFYNKSLLHLLILSEIIIILFICIISALMLLFNIYYLVGLSLIILVFGGLELAINLLFLVIKC